MKNNLDIQIRLLSSSLLSCQNENTFLKEKLANCVSREQYETACTERDMNARLLKDQEKSVAEAKARIEELEIALSQANQEIERLKSKEFQPSSELLEEMEPMPTKLPDSHVAMLALLSGMKREAEKMFGNKPEDAPKEDIRKKGAKRNRNRKSRANHKSERKTGSYTKDVAEALGLDTSALPANAKLLARADGPDTWVFRVLFAQRVRVYSKEYTIGRFYLPGEKDLVNSAYPAGIHHKCHLSPSFVAFYLRMKISYNVSEQNILRALKAAGCSIPQTTLNKYIQRVEKEIQTRLQQAMIEEIQQSRFTHNDETRLRVKCPDKKTGIIGYHTEYVHGILSPSSKLLLMLYDQGSRGHHVQEQIMENSRLECFVCDKAKMYPKIVKDLFNWKGKEIIRGGCWVHWRRDVLDLARYDKRFRALLRALQLLFGLEAKWREEGLDEHERLEKRQELSRPVVNHIFSMLNLIRSNPQDYGKRALDVVDYVLNDKEAFAAFLDHGLIEIDNNAVERCFRHIAMGRRTWLFTGSHEAAENLAFMFSLEESCKMNGLDFGDYIEYVLERMVAGEEDYRSLLPNRIQIPADWIPEGQIDCSKQEKSA